jgi:phosphatidylinositol glycan class S
LGDFEAAFAFAKNAFVQSEEAFFDPNMLALLYFPDEHKYAVYALPFLPATLQLISAVYHEWKVRRTLKSGK